MKYKWQILILITAFYILVSTINSVRPHTQGVIKPTSLVNIEVEAKYDGMVGLINTERNKFGLKPLKENSTLNTTARIKACDMNRNKYFSHKDLRGRMSWHLFTSNGYYYDLAGENLARLFKTDTEAMRAFVKSKTHRENILGDFDEIGIGRCGVYIVQHFGRR